MGDPTFDGTVRSVKSGLISNSSDSCIGKLPLYAFVYLLVKFGDTFFMKVENLCKLHSQLSSFESGRGRFIEALKTHLHRVSLDLK